SNASVLSVSPDGTARALVPGTARVRAEIEGKQAEVNVEVTARAVASVRISPSSAQLTVGSARQFSAVALDEGGEELEGRAASWARSNASVLSVSADGSARAVAPGTARVRVQIEGKQAEATVEVTARAVASVRIAPTSAQLT